jgi:AraC-like DNA-binding protein
MKRVNQETLHFFNLPGLQGLQAVHGINVANEFRRHVHNRFCIGIVLKGTRVICCGNMSITIPEDSLFVINPGESHACKSRHGGHSYFTVCIEAESMKASASQISGKESAVPYFKNILLCDKELVSEIRRFFSLVVNTCSSLERESVQSSLLSTLIMRYGNEPPIPRQTGSHDGSIKRVCEFIRMYYSQDLLLKQLSREACLSPFYFQRLFLENTGISPHDYLIQFRIKKAQEFLAKGHSIAGVALDTGFVDQSHFTRSFKRVTGITPGVYISQCKRT